MSKERSVELKKFLEELATDSECDFTDLNAVDGCDDNALHRALWGKEFAIGRELIELGIDLNAHGDLGKTPVHVAASQGYVEMLDLMVEHGADLFALDEGKYTPIMSAALRNQKVSVAFLRQHMKQSDELKKFLAALGDGADEVALKAAIFDDKFELVRELVYLGFDRFCADEEGRQPIHHAASIGNLEVVKLLVRASCITSKLDGDGYSPLSLAELFEHKDVAEYLRGVSLQIQKDNLRRAKLKVERLRNDNKVE